MSVLAHLMRSVPAAGAAAVLLMAAVSGCGGPEPNTGDRTAGTSAEPAQRANAAGPERATAAQKDPAPAGGPSSAVPEDKNASKPTDTAEKLAAKPPQQDPGRVRRVPPPAPRLQLDDEEFRRQAAEDMIYATIRVRMEEMIVLRKRLLDGGRPGHDPEVRELEGRIMRARQLLFDNGEDVEEVDPPLVESARPQR